MDLAISVVSLLLVLFLVARGVPGRNILVVIAITLAVVILVVGVERSGMWPSDWRTR
ncbi:MULTISPECIES: hypothetical protein [Methylobacterium]|jgi:hypothetical protein|uniref:Uncharacterized protein n=1 Tax=Methylobacterium isbiliense TaxID=315478 RepID=A0ABQ4SFA4_9HYPH|nr:MULTISPECIES: hypothetical protein [Methylobacterium]MBY0298838.1 hypothetical protein [Methylobacterium sp.]MDN3626330.1 hypothetical protein [Methylobacterium isbiliense]GJE01747.1 hypothetical protein GMJLKIPL_3682 [Methylobacterium isbiliense]